MTIMLVVPLIAKTPVELVYVKLAVAGLALVPPTVILQIPATGTLTVIVAPIPMLERGSVIVPVVTPLAYDTPLRSHGLLEVLLPAAVPAEPLGPAQLVHVVDVMVPSGLLNPLPLLSVPGADDEEHVKVDPIVGSANVVVVPEVRLAV
jgi:hypothetical protein